MIYILLFYTAHWWFAIVSLKFWMFSSDVVKADSYMPSEPISI